MNAIYEPRGAAADTNVFLDAVNQIVRIWQDAPKAGIPDGGIRGCAFSILVLLDGGHVGCPGAEVRLLDQAGAFGEDIAGGLHELFANPSRQPKNAIYEPRGAAAEYAPLACNLYRGCGHGCKYCYAPACLRVGREEFAKPAPRPGILTALAKDAEKLRAAGDKRAVLLCFTCDPYQPIEVECQLTRQAIEILGQAGLAIRALTKAPCLAMRDLDLMRQYHVEFGVSLVWHDDDRRKEWEPHAESVYERKLALREAAAAGLSTWVSMEPVIYPAEALAVLREIAGKVGIVKIGKINHDKAREAAVDWRQFTQRATDICQAVGQAYYIKNDLMRACGGEPGLDSPQAWRPAK
jgi:DNA repair photolyase